jgi:hypothetical protein
MFIQKHFKTLKNKEKQKLWKNKENKNFGKGNKENGKSERSYGDMISQVFEVGD